MSGKCMDLTGQRFGRLTVEKRAGSATCGDSKWLCRCDCGGSAIARGSALRNGHTRSCGCLQRESAESGKAHTIHGGSKTRLYNLWKGMKGRCQNPNLKGYSRYGARGIAVCEEWQTFAPFRDWALANGYRDDLTIDRIDVNGNYEPGNCRWATWKEQQNNKTNSRFLTFNGEKKTVSQWAEVIGVDPDTLWARIFVSQWPVEKALAAPICQAYSNKGRK